MGLDEQFDFAICDECKKRLENGESKDGMLTEHIMHTYNLIKSLGKTMMMWDDWFEYADIVEDLPREIILLSWHYVFMSDEPNGHWTNRIKKDWFVNEYKKALQSESSVPCETKCSNCGICQEYKVAKHLDKPYEPKLTEKIDLLFFYFLSL